MIITQTPFRMSFFGGGTDMESFFRENSSIIALLFVMIFDSTTLYSYMYVVLTIIHAVPFLCTEKSIKEKCSRIEFLQERKR